MQHALGPPGRPRGVNDQSAHILCRSRDAQRAIILNHSPYQSPHAARDHAMAAEEQAPRLKVCSACVRKVILVHRQMQRDARSDAALVYGPMNDVWECWLCNWMCRRIIFAWSSSMSRRRRCEGRGSCTSSCKTDTPIQRCWGEVEENMAKSVPLRDLACGENLPSARVGCRRRPLRRARP